MWQNRHEARWLYYVAMEEAGSLAWKNRVLSDEELSRLLITKSPLDSMEIIAKQMELRELASLADTVPAAPTISLPDPLLEPSFDPVLAESSSAINIVEPNAVPIEELPTTAIPIDLGMVDSGVSSIDELTARLNQMMAQAQAAEEAIKVEFAEELAAHDEALSPANSVPAAEVPVALEVALDETDFAYSTTTDTSVPVIDEVEDTLVAEDLAVSEPEATLGATAESLHETPENYGADSDGTQSYDAQSEGAPSEYALNDEAQNNVAQNTVAQNRDEFEEALPIEVSTSSLNLTGIQDSSSAFDILATGSADIASAEETVTQFEEEHSQDSQPELVDEIIRSVGGYETSNSTTVSETETEPEAVPVSEGTAESTESGMDDPFAEVVDPQSVPVAVASKAPSRRAFGSNNGARAAASPERAADNLEEPSGTRAARSLLATWNGTGVLLLMACLGYLGALNLMSLESLLSGTFVGLALTGFGFAAAALAARRGHLPQSILSRAAFGVRGAIFPLIPVLIARIGGTAVLSLCAVAALNWFLGSVPASVSVPVGAQGMQIGSGYLVALGVLLLGYLATLFSKHLVVWIHRVVAGLTVLGSLAIVVMAYLHDPSGFVLGGPLDFARALGTASLVMAIIGMLWGTSAADENPDLQATTMVPKLLAGGLLNFSLLGSLAAAAGWGFYQLRSTNITSLLFGVVFAVLAMFAFANLIRRNADTLAGLGLKQHGPVVRGLLVLVVAAVSLFFVWKIGSDLSWSVLTSYLIFIAVPVLSWLTIFGSDSVLRRTNYHEVSLLRSYGFYGGFNWANLAGWAVATAAGWGFISTSVPELAWVGYLNKLVGTEGLALSSNLGVWVALGISILVPIALTIPRIKTQEAEVVALERRRTELIDVLGISE